MLEETVMEKKTSSRPGSVPPKGNGGLESKKQENGAKFPKQGRRKEGQGGKGRGEPPQGRKTTYPLSNKPGARPRPRGYNGGGQRDEMNLDRRVEPGSALMEGSKKGNGNLNHLLNFTFTPREGAGGMPGNTGWKGRNKWSRKGPKYNKEQFLQANCQFIVKDTGDYTVHAGDPDRLVDWDLIEQVRIFSHEVPSCPICLYPPTAAKITRCGHIYCWSCILHFLSLDEGDKKRNWRKCPICYDYIYQKDLKSVTSFATHHYVAGEKITMKLMKRARGSTYTVPQGQWAEREAKLHQIDDDVDTRFVKLLVASADQVNEKIVSKEKQQLLQQKREEGESLESSFVDAALTDVTSRETSLNVSMAASNEASEMIKGLKLESEETQDDMATQKITPSWGAGGQGSSKTVTEYASAFDDEEASSDHSDNTSRSSICLSEEHENHSLEDQNIHSLEGQGNHSPEGQGNHSPEGQENHSLNSQSNLSQEEVVTKENGTKDDDSKASEIIENEDMSRQSEEGAMGDKTQHHHNPSTKIPTAMYYFYQAEDGQHIYLHSLNARCLIKEYGSLEQAPEVITAEIIEMEAVSMNEELRRRLKYLNHLPLTCEFQVAELAFKSPILSKKTLAVFQNELDKRRRMRHRKDRDDKRRNKKITIEENKKMGIQPGLHIPIESRRQFPEYRDSFSESLPSPSSSTSSQEPTPLGSPLGSYLNPNACEFNPSASAHNPSVSANNLSGHVTHVGSIDSVSSDLGEQGCTPVSFAQMLKAGHDKPRQWPIKSSSKPVPSVKPQGGGHVRIDSEESDNEDRVPVPEFHASFGDAIQAALDKGKADSQDGSDGAGSKKKKKQGKKKLLFTTSMARNG